MLMFDPQTQSERPTVFTIPEHDASLRPRERPMTAAEQRHLRPILGHLASGSLPLDPETRRALKRYLGAVHSQAQRGSTPE